jgi:hexosaminidase
VRSGALSVLLPRPRRRVPLAGAFTWPAAISLPVLPAGCARLAWDLAQLACALQEHAKVRVMPASSRAACLLRLEIRPTASVSGSKEGYTLRVDRTGVCITAPAAAGLAMGVRTLIGLVQGSKGRVLHGVSIEDAPDLTLRAAHLDLMLTRPSLAGWERIVDRLALCKYNAVILEYNGAFPFSRSLGIATKDAFSKPELRRMLAMLAERGFEAIPLQQCFGHFEHVLRHPRYAHLREDGRHLGQPCPLHPESARLVRRLLDEVAEMHAGCTRFHMGGDEVIMGKCPRCAVKAATCGCAGIYSDFVTPLVEHVLARGFKPMLWADMFLRYYTIHPRLAGKVTLVDWNYDAVEGASTAAFWRLYRELTPDEFHNHFPDPAHPEHQAAFRNYFPRPGEKIDPLYTTRYLQDRGYEVAGASAVSVGSQWLPKLSQNLANVACQAASAVAKQAAGSVVTRWGACLPAWEAAEPGFAAGAACAWNAKQPAAELATDLARSLWGLRQSRTLAAWTALADLELPLSRLASVDWVCVAAPEPRDVRLEIRELLRRERPAELAKRLRKAVAAARALVRAAQRETKMVRRNRDILEYAAFAGALAELRCRELLLILRGLAGRPAAVAERRTLTRAEVALEKRAAALFGRRLTPASVQSMRVMLFAGERRLADLAAPERLAEVLPG